MNNNKSGTKKKKAIEEAAERLAEILIMQIEWNRKNNGKKNYSKKKL